MLRVTGLWLIGQVCTIGASRRSTSLPPSSMSRALALVDSSDESRNDERAGRATQLLETKLYVPRSRIRPRSASEADRRAPSGSRAEAHGRRRARRFRKDDAARRMARGYASAESSGRLGLARSERERADDLLDVFHRGAAEDSSRCRARRQFRSCNRRSRRSIESILTTLINEIDALDRDFTLVLDDYHVIDAAPIHAR